MTDEERRARSHRANSLMDEFLSPIVEELHAEYLSAVTQLAANEPWAVEKITKLSVALRVVSKVEQQIRAIVQDGEHAAGRISRAQEIAKMPAARRRWLW